VKYNNNGLHKGGLLEVLYTSYNLQDMASLGQDAWFSFCIDNVIIPLKGPNGYNSRTLFFVDGYDNTCCAWGIGGDAGWAGVPGWITNNIETYLTTNNYDARPDIGAIGHELGHAFDMPHEDGHSDNGSVNCDDQCIPKGIMCNGGSPSPCGTFNGYPAVAINGWNNNYFGQYPEYFSELGGTCNGPSYVYATGGSSQNLAGNTFVIRSKGSNKVLTAENGNIVQKDYTGASNQEWLIGPESYGLNRPERIRFSQIINAGTGNLLDNQGFNMDPGGNIAIYPNTGNLNQYWRIINRGGGDYAVQNLLSGRVMDVQGGSTAENANIQQWQWNGSNAQLWKFEQPDPCLTQGGDTDGDGVCNNQDVCPGMNDGLIGTATACNDNNPATDNDLWQSDCSCQGTLICTIGGSCEDGDPCTTGETYDTSCNCVGGTLVTTDADNDGVCDAADQCPGLNDNLIGQPCDDGNPLTLGDVYTNCQCAGLLYGCDDPNPYSDDCDFDLDGLTNAQDQDDDNDGILDIEECPTVAEQVNNPSFDGTVGSAPAGWTDYGYIGLVSDINTPAAGYSTKVPAANSSDGFCG